MNQRIDVIGIGADGPAGLRPELIERIHGAQFLAGGERHLHHFAALGCQRFVIKDNVRELVEELGQRCPTQRCAVLASGDPLFYGIGRRIIGVLGSDAVRVEPALSSMQLAFARVGVSWQNAALASAHGRALRPTLLPLLGRGLIGLFTQDGDGPAAVGRFFFERGLTAYQAAVAENLGAAEERVTPWLDLGAVTTLHFAPLNYLILRRTGDPASWNEVERRRVLAPGVPDDAFARPAEGPEVMTRQEVRSVIVGKLLGATEPGDTIWDIGAGLGTVSVEVAVLRPPVEVIAVERDAGRVSFLRSNRERFGAYNVRVVEGTAPDALVAEADRPRLVFVGGSGGNLPAILDLVADRLREGGRLVAGFVTLEHLGLALDRLRRWQWPVGVTELHVSRSDSLAGLTSLKPQRGVFVVSGDKPGAGRE
jgi:precorrin-6Y C5,15-methyltransferase (decarboxylating)